ncbi:hypothetical protein D3C80_1952680 [compost metagenome]
MLKLRSATARDARFISWSGRASFRLIIYRIRPTAIREKISGTQIFQRTAFTTSVISSTGVWKKATVGCPFSCRGM